MSIADAIEELATLLSEGRDAEEAVNEVSGDFGLNPALVRRKFAEKHGAAPDRFAAPPPKRTRERELTTARAIEWSKGYSWGEAVVPPGTIFRACGSEWAFVGLQRKDVTGARVIALQVGKVERPSYDEILSIGCVPCLRGLTFEAAAEAIINSVIV